MRTKSINLSTQNVGKVQSTNCLWIAGLTEATRRKELESELTYFASLAKSSRSSASAANRDNKPQVEINWTEGAPFCHAVFDTIRQSEEVRFQLRGKRLANNGSDKLRIDFAETWHFRPKERGERSKARLNAEAAAAAAAAAAGGQRSSSIGSRSPSKTSLSRSVKRSSRSPPTRSISRSRSPLSRSRSRSRSRSTRSRSRSRSRSHSRCSRSRSRSHSRSRSGGSIRHTRRVVAVAPTNTNIPSGLTVAQLNSTTSTNREVELTESISEKKDEPDSSQQQGIHSYSTHHHHHHHHQHFSSLITH